MANLLIVDVRGTHADFLKAFLRGRGHRATIAADAAAIRAALETALFDALIVTDAVPALEGLDIPNLALIAWLDDSVEIVHPDGSHASHARSLEALDAMCRAVSPKPAEGPSQNVIRASQGARIRSAPSLHSA